MPSSLAMSMMSALTEVTTPGLLGHRDVPGVDRTAVLHTGATNGASLQISGTA
ncbi:MAG: hypothetical protein R2742_08625 [Micropruina glycogenica]